MERKTSLSLPRDVSRLFAPNLWVHAVQDTPLVLNNLPSRKEIKSKVGYTLCTAQSPAQTVLQTAIIPVGWPAPLLCYLALPLRLSRPSWTS